MSIRVECESCGKVMNAKDEAAGKKTKCPGCGEILQVPANAIDAEEDGGGYDDAASDEKACPACGENIKAKALKCRHCGEVFDSSLKKKSSKAGLDDDMSTGDWVVAILCSGIGCIAGIVWMIQGKKKGLKMFGISLGVQLVWVVVRLVIEASLKNQ